MHLKDLTLSSRSVHALSYISVESLLPVHLYTLRAVEVESVHGRARGPLFFG